MSRFYLVVEGRVQGVGFRYFCQMQALRLSLTGFVRNMNNGMVEIEVQGEKDSIDKFLVSIHKGNGFSKIENYSIKKISLVENEKKFIIV